MDDILDKTALMDRMGHDPEFLAVMLERYERDRVALMYQMHEAVSRRDSSALADIAHVLIGLVGSLSAKPALDAAFKIRAVAEKGDFSDAEQALASLEDETRILRTALQEIVKRREQNPVAASGGGAHAQLTAYPIRVITIDDQEIARNGIRFILVGYDDIELVGEAASGEESLRLCDELKPDVVLMDLKMPNMDGVAATSAIKQQHPDIKVLVLTVYHGGELVSEALQAGAVGYVMKDASRSELANAIRAARDGRTILSADAATDLVAISTQPSTSVDIDLTKREREILTMLAEGMRNNQIADKISKSPYTVRHYVSELITKLGAHNRAEAAAIAVKQGLVD